MNYLIGVTVLLAIVALYFRVADYRTKKRRDSWLTEYRSGHVNYDNVMCQNLRAGGWSEERIKSWCNTTRCVYYSAEYNSTDL